MARHRLLVTIAAAALAAGCVAALDPGSEPYSGPDLGLGSGPGIVAPAAPRPATTTESRQGLYPGLVRAYDAAAAAAAADGHRLTITSGYRTAEEQQALLNAEIKKRGSVKEALRWVFTPERSMHVRGLAIDVGDRRAADWLDDEGARFGLCRTLAWEWWHFEWRAAWERDRSCPRPARNPAGAPT